MLIKEKITRSEATGIRQSPLDRFIDKAISEGKSINVYALTDKNGKRLPPAVCMCIGCCIKYRTISAKQTALFMPVTKALKTIYLAKYLYNEFEYWYRSVCPEDESEAHVGLLTILGVEIKRQSTISTETMSWEFYPVKTATA